jgi:fimbrial protein
MFVLCLMGDCQMAVAASDRERSDIGDVHFQGQVVKAACSVRADSSDQIVAMGQVRSDEFTDLGTWADPTPFSIYLEDCDNSVSHSAGVLFTGMRDSKDPLVFKTGFGAGAAQGVGLGIFSGDGKIVIPNTEPLWQAPLIDGEVVLHFMAKYRATSVKVTPGVANATVWFSIFYQ